MKAERSVISISKSFKRLINVDVPFYSRVCRCWPCLLLKEDDEKLLSFADVSIDAPFFIGSDLKKKTALFRNIGCCPGRTVTLTVKKVEKASWSLAGKAEHMLQVSKFFFYILHICTVIIYKILYKWFCNSVQA